MKTPVRTITRKERMRRALEHAPLDRIPAQINHTQAMGLRMAAHLGVSHDQLPQRLVSDAEWVRLDHEPRRSENGRVALDWWGGRV